MAVTDPPTAVVSPSSDHHHRPGEELILLLPLMMIWPVPSSQSVTRLGDLESIRETIE